LGESCQRRGERLKSPRVKKEGLKARGWDEERVESISWGFKGRLLFIGGKNYRGVGE